MNTSANIISQYFEGREIRQRANDGYISASDLCSALGKQFTHYNHNKSTIEYLEALESDLGIPRSQLIESKKGNSNKFDQGSWVHPQVATHLAQWLSPKLAVQVNKWLIRYLSGDLSLIPAVIKNNELTTGSKIISVEYVDLQDRIMNIEERKLALEVRRTELEERRATAREAQIRALNAIEQVKKIDCHLYVAMKNDFINSIMPTNYTAIQSSEANENNIMLNKDLSTLAKEELGQVLPNSRLCALGKLVKKGYQDRYNADPVKTDKHVAGAIRSICVYPPIDHEWIRDIIRKFV